MGARFGTKRIPSCLSAIRSQKLHAWDDETVLNVGLTSRPYPAGRKDRNERFVYDATGAHHDVFGCGDGKAAGLEPEGKGIRSSSNMNAGMKNAKVTSRTQT